LEPRVINGCGALIRASSTGRYLFLLRDKSSYDNTWGLPGGKIENGETVVCALERELREELGTTIEYRKIVPIETYTSDNRRFIYHTFLLAVDEEFIPRLNREHRGYCWVYIEDCPTPLHPGVWRTVNFESVKRKLDTLEQILQVC
jgi:8-oxo-dGTP pyrophosphatase MutT (NUDIX family)